MEYDLVKSTHKQKLVTDGAICLKDEERIQDME